MPPLPKPNDSNFAPPPSGTHLAVCYRVIDLGTQETTYKGQTKHQHKVLISWELPDEPMPDGEKAGEPFTIHQRYTWSMSEKAALRRDLEAWRGLAFQEKDFGPGGFDIKNVVAKSCMMTIVHQNKDGKVYANIASLGKLPKGMKAPDFPRNDPQFCWLSPEEFDKAVFDNLSDNLKQSIMRSPEYRAIGNGAPEETVNERNPPPNDFEDTEIPF